VNHILIVRLGSLGDIVHALPAAAALREAFPRARIDWLVDARHRELLECVPVVDRAILLRAPTIAAWMEAVRELRRTPYDAAVDFQGLMKSAVLARASGARRVLGFSIWHLRERGARPFYSEAHDPGAPAHVIQKNLALIEPLGIAGAPVRFPLQCPGTSPAVASVRQWLGPESAVALINPGAAWPNKRWPPARFGELAARLRDRFGLRSIVLWGPGEDELGTAVVAASNGAALAAPPTSIADLVQLAREASLFVSGDTGPLHIAAAVGTPIVGIYGPTDPARNGPWSPADVTVSRFARCGCHHRRRCRAAAWCLDDIGVDEVTTAAERRLSTVR
jgi:lipopolysaccharide heptosyltransferase I